MVPALVVLAVLVATLGPVLHFPVASRGSTLGAGRPAATTMMVEAQESLARGEGPADGEPLSCQSVGDDVSSSCEAFAPVSTRAILPASAAFATPAARFGASMTYDAADGYVLLFSGSNHNDTWTFANGTWTQQFPARSPPLSVSASMTYDAHDGFVVLFGGEGKSEGNYLNTTYLTDTWSFVHGNWTNLTPGIITSSDLPSPRYGAAMAYDSRDSDVVLFGGDSRRSFLNDTWKFVGGEWTNITATAGGGPSCRFDAGIADDPSEGYVLLFGGVGKRPGGGCGPNILNGSAPGTWSFAGGAWKELYPVTSPPAVWDLGMTFDAADGYVVLFGGIGSNDTASQQTWKYEAGNWNLVEPGGYPPTSPPARFALSLTDDPHDRFVLLFGGLSEPQHDAPSLADAWAYRGSIWANLTENPSPPPRSSAAMTYDVKDGYVLLFGGYTASGPLSDTWKFAAGVWLELTPPQSPPARYGASMAYDSNGEDQFVVLFGGMSGAGALGDTWSFVKGEWTNLTPELPNVSNSPSPRTGAAMTYDPEPKIASIVLFGGQGLAGTLSDTWRFLDGTWTRDQAGGSPPGRTNASFAFDGSMGDDYCLLFGGLNGTTVLGDSWEFTASGTWSPLEAGTAPEPRSGASLVYDSVDGYLVLFGGTRGTAHFGDTWTLAMGLWNQLFPTPTPSARFGAAAAYDAPDSLVLLYGGTGSTSLGGLAFNDTWAFSGTAWVNISLDRTPLPATGIGPSSQSEAIEIDAVGTGGAAAVVIVCVVLVRRRKRNSSIPDPAPPSAPPPTA